MTATTPPRRSLYYIEHELRRMRRHRIRLLRNTQVKPMPPSRYADEAVALIREAIALDPDPEPVDWAARALGIDDEPIGDTA
jgi:hypothetical protein